ncbi:MAG: dCTP deaminase [Candidatus Omnitrophica bacterium]|nr:dCTP deaminase [Candidatus Omnitrophota bacterium]
MRIYSGEESAKLVGDLVSEKHQVKPRSIELTVAAVYQPEKAGEIDFGGSEQKKADSKPLEPEKRSEDDKYGWWNLTEGEYFVEFNETVKVPEGSISFLRPLPRTLEGGGIQPSLIYMEGEEITRVPLSVGKTGFNIKENARISSATFLEI